MKGLSFRKAQAIVEYILLLTAVMVVVLLAFNTLSQKYQSETNGFFNAVLRGIMGQNATDKARTGSINYP